MTYLQKKLKLLTLLSIIFIPLLIRAEGTCPIQAENLKKPLRISACAGIQTITSYQELKELMSNNSVLLIDVRSKKEFEAAHIKGAISVPIGERPELILKTIAPDCKQKIVVYCENQIDYMRRSFSLSELGYLGLRAIGYENVSQLEPFFNTKIMGVEILIEGNDIKSSPFASLLDDNESKN